MKRNQKRVMFVVMLAVVLTAPTVLGGGLNNALKVHEAVCSVEPTSHALAAGATALGGWVKFTIAEGATPSMPQSAAETMTVSWDLSGFPTDGNWGWHVHQIGDVLSVDASATSGHYIGTPTGRAEVGDFGVPFAFVGGASTGDFVDSSDNAALNGRNNIVGRSLVFHQPVTGTRMAQCVIGIANGGQNFTAPTQLYTHSSRAVRKAGCVLAATTASANPDIVGNFFFTLDANSDLHVSYFINGLSEGLHTFHVHEFGDITSGNGASTGAHYVGESCAGGADCRPPGLADEVGTLANPEIWSHSGVASGSFTDPLATLDWGDSAADYIVGRSIIVHGEVGNAGTRVAQCVIGILNDDDVTPTMSTPGTGGAVTTNVYTSEAVAVMTPTSISVDNNARGVIHFTTHRGTLNHVEIRYFLTGLTPGAHGWHIHTFGDVSASTAKTQGGHYVGTCSNCRPGADEQTAGFIADGAAIVADANGVARGVVTDTVLRLFGTNSVVARGVVIHNADGSRAAQGVVGRMVETASSGVTDLANESEGICIFESTSNAPTGDNSAIHGWISFREQATGTKMDIDWQIYGLADGVHGIHIHDFGNTLDVDFGLSTGGHFIGSAPSRPTFPSEIGAIPVTLTSTNGYSEGSVVDDPIEINGDDGILGRAVTIHGDGTTGGIRVAQCVIGVAMPPRAFVKVDKAVCALEPTTAGTGNEAGTVTFELHSAGQPPRQPQMGAENMTVSFSLQGFADGDYTWHVHTWGDVQGDNGMTVGGHYIGDPAGRPEVGDFQSGTITVTGNVATGSFDDTSNNAALNGKNNIIGRSLIFHHVDDGGKRKAQCVIGIAQNGQNQAWNAPKYTYADARAVRRAGCRIQETSVADDVIAGHFFFEETSAGLAVQYYVAGAGLTDGSHSWHIHQFGDITSGDGASTGGHYVGESCYDGGGASVNCRPEASVPADEVGTFVDSTILAANGWATGSFTDNLATLDSGHASKDYIVGRSIIIHGKTGNTGARVAQCVIGDIYDSEDGLHLLPPAPASQATSTNVYTTSAVAYVEPTTGNGARGVAQFVRTKGPDGKLEIRYHFSGLAVDSVNSWHIHTYGDVSDAAGATLQGGHYVGDCSLCRGGGGGNEQTAGLIANGTKIYADGNGVARGVVTDDVLRLHGINSVVGRGVVVHGPTGTRIGQGVVGRATETSRAVDDVAAEADAICVFAATANNAAAVTGWMRFEEVAGGKVGITWSIAGLSAGNHGVHIHDWGNTLDMDQGVATGGHFIGSAPTRAGGYASEVGALPNPFTASAAGVTEGVHIDNFVKLGGADGVIGRAVTVHGNAGSTSVRVAQCVIGAATAPVASSDDSDSTAGGGGGGTNDNLTAMAMAFAFFAVVAAIGGIYFCYDRNYKKNAGQQQEMQSV